MRSRVVLSLVLCLFASGAIAQTPMRPSPDGAAVPGGSANAPENGQGGRPGGVCNAPCDPYPNMKKLLVVADVQTGYHHDSINHTMAVIEELGRKNGVYVSFLRTDSQLVTKGPITASSARYAGRSINARNLNYFDAVFFLGAGEGTMSDQQKSDLLSFVRDDGKGIILGHAQGVNLYNWPEWGNLIGGFMNNEYPATGMWATVVDPKWKAAAAFGKESFFWTDQWPVLKPEFKRGDVHTIVALDPSKMTAQEHSRARPDNYLPIVWAKQYGKGRVFNFTGGHNDATLDDPKTQALLLEGIEWALGLTSEDASPDKK